MNKYIPFVIAFALFMETLDATIITTSIPKIALSLNTDPINLKLAITSYLLSLAVFIPLSGWLADKLGTKIIFISSLLIFTLGSLLCGLAVNLSMLVVSRIVQGIGGALMMPVGRLILLKSFPKDELIKITNYATIPSLIGPTLGPVLSGVIVSYINWRWIFFINLPFGIIGTLLANKILTNITNSTDNNKFYFCGFVLFGTGIAGLAFALESLGGSSFPTNTLLEIIIAASFLLAFYFIRAYNVKHPFIDLSLFKIRTFRITVLGSFICRCGIGGMLFLLPLFFQLGLNHTPLHSGLMLLPYALGMIVVKFHINALLKLLGFRTLLIVNTLLLGISVSCFAIMTQTSPIFLVILMIFVHGLSCSVQFTCMNTLSYSDLSPTNISKGTSIASAIQQLSMSFGVAISAIILKSLLVYYDYIFKSISHAFHETFVIIGTITVLSTIIFMFLSKNDGVEISGNYCKQTSSTTMRIVK